MIALVEIYFIDDVESKTDKRGEYRVVGAYHVGNKVQTVVRQADKVLHKSVHVHAEYLFVPAEGLFIVLAVAAGAARYVRLYDDSVHTRKARSRRVENFADHADTGGTEDKLFAFGGIVHQKTIVARKHNFAHLDFNVLVFVHFGQIPCNELKFVFSYQFPRFHKILRFYRLYKL